MNRPASLFAFALPVLAGLAAVAWVGAGYAGSHPLALAVTVLIGAFFLLGVAELARYRQATRSLTQALAGLQAPAPPLADWLDGIAPALRQPVRQRIEGDRAGLPAPALAPYLAGLLVLLGMLGTFAGMVVTLRGTGLALQSASDLAAVRASLAAPVQGLGVAFGTSLAGVATSAMLGLLSALARRERALAALQLDSCSATTLRAYSRAQQREAAFELMQRQAEALPALADRLQALTAELTQQHGALAERLLAEQHRFHQQAEAAYAGLASSVDRSLRDSLAESARLAGAALQPAVQATLAGLADEGRALQAGVSASVQGHLDALAQRFDHHNADVARHWQQALAGQQQTHAQLAGEVRTALAEVSQGFQRSAGALVEQLGARLADTTGALAERGQALLAQQAEAGQRHAEQLAQQLGGTAAHFGQQTAALLQGAQQALAHGQAQADARSAEQLGAWRAALAEHQRSSQRASTETQQALADTARQLARQSEALQQRLDTAQAALQTQAAEREARQLAAWSDALARQAQTNDALTARMQEVLASTQAQLDERAQHLIENLAQRNTDLREQLSTQEQQRLAHWQQALTALGDTLRTQWQQAGADSARQQQAVCDTLAGTAQALTAQSAQQAQATVAEITRLLDAAAAAPRAAAEVIGELREQLSASMARDNALLDERARVLDTLGTLLEQVNHASAEQRQAIDQLVDGSAEVLQRTAARLAERLEADSGRLAEAAAQVGAGATEIASLGDAFGQAVQAFGQSNAQLGAHLQQLDATLAQSIARSDEQLAYYVAQAREVIDLSLSSQQQIVGDLQRLAHERAAAAPQAEAPSGAAA